jgi:hypothetical protein
MNDLRRLFAEALADVFTRDTIEAKHPADRLDREMRIVVTGPDGRPMLTGVDCMRAAQVCVNVRDEQMAGLRAQLADAEDALTQVREMAEQWRAIPPHDEADWEFIDPTGGLRAAGRSILAALDGEETTDG